MPSFLEYWRNLGRLNAWLLVVLASWANAGELSQKESKTEEIASESDPRDPEEQKSIEEFLDEINKASMLCHAPPVEPALGFEPYGFQFASGGGFTHQVAGMELLLMWPNLCHFENNNWYFGIGWAMASIHVKLGLDILFMGGRKAGPLLRLGGRIEPLSWINRTPKKFGEAKYTIGVLGEAGLGWQFLLGSDIRLRVVLQYLGGPRWPLSLGDGVDVRDAKPLFYRGCILSLRFSG